MSKPSGGLDGLNHPTVYDSVPTCSINPLKFGRGCEQLKSWWNVCTQSTKMGCSEKMHFAVEGCHGVNHSFSFVGRTGSGSPGVGSADSRVDGRRGRADGSASG